MITPTPAAARIVFWDVLRGVAVLGILLANMPYMALVGGITDPFGNHAGDGVLDHVSFYAVYVFADTKFITIFSILFGAGLAWMYQRIVDRGERFGRIYGRRLLVLALIGAFHGICIWFGDILLAYAVLGFIAMLLRKAKVKTLVVTATVLLVLNGLLFIGLGLLDPANFVDLEKAPDGTMLSAEESIAQHSDELREVYGSGDFLRMAERRRRTFLGALITNMLAFGLRTLALFLLGMATVKSRLFVDVAGRRDTYQRLAWLGVSLGLACELVSTTCLAVQLDRDAHSPLLAALQLATLYVGGFALAWGYIGLIALWTMSTRGQWLRDRLAAVGRMALTSYLSHSVITGVVFNYLGYYDQWSRSAGMLLAFAIFAFQLWLSPIWLQRFRLGPVEWLWRTATYWRRVPWRAGK